jgi:hypothetical protein
LDWPDADARTARMPPLNGRWFMPQEWLALGLPAPVARLLGLVPVQRVKRASG